jgi:hypothetical protein
MEANGEVLPLVTGLYARRPMPNVKQSFSTLVMTNTKQFWLFEHNVLGQTAHDGMIIWLGGSEKCH